MKILSYIETPNQLRMANEISKYNDSDDIFDIALFCNGISIDVKNFIFKESNINEVFILDRHFQKKEKINNKNLEPIIKFFSFLSEKYDKILFFNDGTNTTKSLIPFINRRKSKILVIQDGFLGHLTNIHEKESLLKYQNLLDNSEDNLYKISKSQKYKKLIEKHTKTTKIGFCNVDTYCVFGKDIKNKLILKHGIKPENIHVTGSIFKPKNMVSRSNTFKSKVKKILYIGQCQVHHGKAKLESWEIEFRNIITALSEFDLTYKFHPGESEKIKEYIYKNYNSIMEINDEGFTDSNYLSKFDLIITETSSIVLEACILDLPIAIYKMKCLNEQLPIINHPTLYYVSNIKEVEDIFKIKQNKNIVSSDLSNYIEQDKKNFIYEIIYEKENIKVTYNKSINNEYRILQSMDINEEMILFTILQDVKKKGNDNKYKYKLLKNTLNCYCKIENIPNINSFFRLISLFIRKKIIITREDLLFFTLYYLNKKSINISNILDSLIDDEIRNDIYLFKYLTNNDSNNVLALKFRSVFLINLLQKYLKKEIVDEKIYYQVLLNNINKVSFSNILDYLLFTSNDLFFSNVLAKVSSIYFDKLLLNKIIYNKIFSIDFNCIDNICKYIVIQKLITSNCKSLINEKLNNIKDRELEFYLITSRYNILNKNYFLFLFNFLKLLHIRNYRYIDTVKVLFKPQYMKNEFYNKIRKIYNKIKKVKKK